MADDNRYLGGLSSERPSIKTLLEYALLSKRMEDDALRSVIAQNMDKNFVQRIASANPTTSRYLPERDGYASHKMAWADNMVFPTIENRGDNLVPLPRGQRPQEAINMGSPYAADWFSQNYKRTNPQGFGIPNTESVIKLLRDYLKR